MLSRKAASVIYRIIDANTNRLKEGLRVCEEIFRFIVEDRRITRLLKGIRHQADALAAALACRNRRLAARDSARDTGRSMHTCRELKRSGVGDLFAANIQRVKESIRVLEEFSKLTDTKCALGFKELRYRVYEIEQRAAKAIGSRYR